MAEAGDAFWAFSLAFYGWPEVAAACLALQDRHGRDVNLVLYLCWVGLSGRGRLDAADLARADSAIAPWRRETIEKLRAARRALKGAAGYDAAKAAELAAEQVAQQRLAALAPSPSPRSAAVCAADAAANLMVYLDDGARLAAAPLFTALASVVGGGDAEA
jgi:uncharacterized protein (TIGR02444 family)